MNKQFNIEASVHKQLPNGSYRVKVSLLDLGMYINGAMVFAPSPEHAEWAVYMPSQRAGRGAWKPILEFNKKLSLWSEIYIACINAVELDISLQESETGKFASHRHTQDVVLTDIDDEPIRLEDIPFE